jgi:dTDP-4-dehydrorhamnose 3,5-epimerase
MQVTHGDIDDVLLFTPQVHRDVRGYFTRTFDAATAASVGLDAAAFVQDSQSRSALGVVRGMHLRVGAGEAKLVRCAHGAVLDVLVDARPGSSTFGTVSTIGLDDVAHVTLYVPRGVLHGWQALTPTADVCYRIDAEHDPAEDVSVAFDDPELAIPWPLPVTLVSERDRAAGSWRSLRESLRAQADQASQRSV